MAGLTNRIGRPKGDKSRVVDRGARRREASPDAAGLEVRVKRLETQLAARNLETAGQARSEAEVRRLLAAVEERVALIERLRTEASTSPAMPHANDRHLSAGPPSDQNPAIGSAQGRLGVLERELADAHHAMARLQAELATARNDLDLTRQALEAEQAHRREQQRAIGESYKQLKRRIVETVERIVPSRATIAVVSKGDEDLVRLNGRRAWHFPQTTTAAYAGYHPADSAAAIDHLERLRAKGAQFLLFPATSRWWLEHYTEFAEHLLRIYRQVFERDDVGVVFDVRRARALRRNWKSDFTTFIEEFQVRFRRDPAILDCETGLDVASSFPQHTLFSPPDGSAVLPYLDSTVDVVVCRAASPRAKEARRVARMLLLTATAGTNGAQRSPGAVRLQAEWLEPSPARASRAVSIIIPCYNGLSLTRSCLAAVEATVPSSLNSEIIVVDDASTDGTRAFLDRIAKRNNRVRVLRNAKNLGFIRSCNRAARAARGEMLVLLNNDTQPARGWLTALLRTFDDHPDAGAVGGKLVFPDGTLQEAGSLVFRDGSAANFGRGDDNPDHPLFNHVRQVDYCSAALLATPRRLFLDLEGFDSCYIPAYYEDTDYCFKLHDQGYGVYYQPAARVTHHEGASCGTDLTQGVKHHQDVNRETFRKRWKTALERQPERPQHENFDAWQRLAVRSA